MAQVSAVAAATQTAETSERTERRRGVRPAVGRRWDVRARCLSMGTLPFREVGDTTALRRRPFDRLAFLDLHNIARFNLISPSLLHSFGVGSQFPDRPPCASNG
ncbi:protein of unknown function (plasmid) [Streptantibioticus cattleyicolor NRRL 8057 = DSM 46488]|nr:protein of unknown function [Streptantibioticus cattleyicolor NRRL 8057 = DSM 46488]